MKIPTGFPFFLTRPTRFRRGLLEWRACALALATCFLGSNASLSQNITFQGGPIMQQVTVYAIYWTPTLTGSPTLDPTVPDGKGNYQVLTQNFFTDLPQSAYFNILTQYFGQCSVGSANTCVPQNSIAAVTFGGAWSDGNAYPAGTLADADMKGKSKLLLQPTATGPSAPIR